MRSVALLLGANALLFASVHSSGQMAATREWLNHLAFRSGAAGGGTSSRRQQPPSQRQPTVLDHNEPLSIGAGADSWSQIGHMPKQAIADVGLMLSAHIPQVAVAPQSRHSSGSSGSGSGSRRGVGGGRDRPQSGGIDVDSMVSAVDPATDPNFREQLVDELRAVKDAELRERCKDMEVRAKFHRMSSAIVDSSSSGF